VNGKYTVEYCQDLLFTKGVKLTKYSYSGKKVTTGRLFLCDKGTRLLWVKMNGFEKLKTRKLVGILAGPHTITFQLKRSVIEAHSGITGSFEDWE
jgi:hypothetical protein